MDKFKFYYEPKGEFDIKSFTISIDREDLKYKVKVVKEVIENEETIKIKIKDYYEEIDEIMKKIDSIDFDRERSKEGDNPLVVKYGLKKIEAKSLKEVEDICKLFRVYELLEIHIEDISDIREFLSK